ncbi:hypothetical protein WSM22_41090 [Cytophagales bacterium WSM2-2]|nr:hypothetical protein WSM22_41090 [Cytophagales bacterium WSM2-2]
MLDCVCENCGFGFFQTLPVGHNVNDTFTISKSGEKLQLIDTKQSWLTEVLLKSFTNENQDEVRIEKKIYHKHKQVVILNTLDFLYGHVLLKLYNSSYHLNNNKDLGLILILPKSFEWLIPSRCAEAWLVDLKLNELAGTHSSIQKFISSEFERFDTIYLSKAYSHPDFSNIDIANFTGVKSFDLRNFISLRPTFTFVLREDRWWLSGILDYWFYRVCRKTKMLKIGGRMLSMSQNGLVKKTISRIREKLPNSRFYIVGLGKVGNFNRYANDQRKTMADESIERAWCRIYSQSHVVIGVHGSNMLLPTAHAAGCVEILPEDRYGNIIQDISVRYSDRKQLYFYRFTDQYASPQTVAHKAISIVEDFEVFEKNMCSNFYSSAQLSDSEFHRRPNDFYAIH